MMRWGGCISTGSSDKKDEVNASERKIGGADLGPVTQLFTENYMVRFLLENSLGAWWAARHPDSPLVKEWEFLRFDDDGDAGGRHRSTGGRRRVAEVTVMDPCCGSGHFLVEAFAMLWQMRAEEEGLEPGRGAGCGAARQPVRAGARSAVCADRDVRGRACGVEGGWWVA